MSAILYFSYYKVYFLTELENNLLTNEDRWVGSGTAISYASDSSMRLCSVAPNLWLNTLFRATDINYHLPPILGENLSVICILKNLCCSPTNTRSITVFSLTAFNAWLLSNFKAALSKQWFGQLGRIVNRKYRKSIMVNEKDSWASLVHEVGAWRNKEHWPRGGYSHI